MVSRKKTAPAHDTGNSRPTLRACLKNASSMSLAASSSTSGAAPRRLSAPWPKPSANKGWQPEIHTSLALSDQRSGNWNGIPIRRYGYCYPFFGLNAEQKAQMDKKGGNLLSLPLFASLAGIKDARLFHAHALKRLGGAVFSAARWRKLPFVVTLHGGVFDVPKAELGQMLEAQKRQDRVGQSLRSAFPLAPDTPRSRRRHLRRPQRT